MPPFLGRQCCSCFDDKTSFPGAKSIPTFCVLSDDLFGFHVSWNLERMPPWLVWCAFFWQNIKLCPKPCFSGAVPPSSQEAVSWAIVLSLTQKTNEQKNLFSCLLIISINRYTFNPSLSPTLGSHSTDLPNSKFLKTPLGKFLAVQLTSISFPSLTQMPQNTDKKGNKLESFQSVSHLTNIYTWVLGKEETNRRNPRKNHSEKRSQDLLCTL